MLRKSVYTILEDKEVQANWRYALMNHNLPGVKGSYSSPSVEELREEIKRCAKDLIVIPDYVKNLGQPPTYAVNYEGLKKTLEYLSQSPQKRLLRERSMMEIDQNKDLAIGAKYDALSKLVQEATIELQWGANDWVQ